MGRLCCCISDDRIVRVAADASHGARHGERRVAVVARGGAVRAEGDGEPQVVARRRRPAPAARPPRCPRARPARSPAPSATARWHRLQSRGQRRRRRACPRVTGRCRAAVVLLVAREALDGRVGELLLARAHVALGAVGEHVHPGQREARHPVDLERPRHPPPGGRWQRRRPARGARGGSPRGSSRTSRLSVRRALWHDDARGVDVLPRQREAGRRVIELHVAAGGAPRLPRRGRVARAARDRVGEALVVRRTPGPAATAAGAAVRRARSLVRVGVAEPALVRRRAPPRRGCSRAERRRAVALGCTRCCACAPVSAQPVIAW